MVKARLKRLSIESWTNTRIEPGETRNVQLAVSQNYSGTTVHIPLQVRRSDQDGPVVFVTAALHGDELNGTGAIRHLLRDPEIQLVRGSLILVPVLNILALESRSRYMPDRRDLNRCFPGSASGSLASRMAYSIFHEIVARSDFGIDLHTASVRRTNFPTVRGTMEDESVAKLARAFGSEIIIDKPGPKSSLRREASANQCPTIIMEGGEVWKVEPAIVDTAVLGVKNVLKSLGMLEGKPLRPNCQVVISKTRWMRAEFGGFLQFHIAPGEIVEKGQPLTTNTSLLGDELGVLVAPFDGVIIGLTTLPTVNPGEPICHIGRFPKGTNAPEIRRLRDSQSNLEERVSDELATNLRVVERKPGQ
ncbi:MAG: succinylglutamate desuccinylase/aspartoacylase family protein [Rhodothermales bacterium]|nr:succinylglutamate desuccinylase/aspartoacylase family protein [Rhodothermales bacterium]